MAEVIVRREGPVLRLTLNRPQRRNALTYAVIDELLDALEPVAGDDTCRVVLLDGAGSGFCSGDDMGGMGEPGGRRWQKVRRESAVIPQQTLIRTLRYLPRPVVVAIHGYALGMGLDVALACDLRICTENAQLGDPRSDRALYAATGITYQLPRAIGYGRALAMMLMAECISGREAERIGLVYRAVPEDEFESAVADIVERFSRAATKSLAVIKEQMAAQMDLSYDLAARHSVALRITHTLEDTQEGIAAFFEKRSPRFTGR